MKPPRIVSLLSSATEILCGLGLSDSLLAVSHECDFPQEVRLKPSIFRAVTVIGPLGAIGTVGAAGTVAAAVRVGA